MIINLQPLYAKNFIYSIFVQVFNVRSDRYRGCGYHITANFKILHVGGIGVPCFYIVELREVVIDLYLIGDRNT